MEKHVVLPVRLNLKVSLGLLYYRSTTQTDRLTCQLCQLQYIQAQLRLLQPSFHGREATCICYVGRVPGGKRDVIATGSEDTNINLMTCIL